MLGSAGKVTAGKSTTGKVDHCECLSYLQVSGGKHLIDVKLFISY